ncbi:MAG TPA: PD-(D/E)XK nuclease family protein, partial [Nitrospirota bacterium]
LGPLEEVSEDISPIDRGSKVHAILRNFYRSWNKPVTSENRAEASGLLSEIAGAAFGSEADTVRNRREKGLFLNRMAERFLDAEEEFWKTGMRPAYLEQAIESFRLVLSDGTEVELSAKIDRIDLDESGNFMIIDYKTGDYPKPKMGMEQEIFQLPIYAAMARQTLAGKDALLNEPIGLAYYDLKGATGAGARDVVLFNKDARDDHPASKPKASPRSAAEFRAIIEQSMDKARSAIEGILKGAFFPDPGAENVCRYCPNSMMCEKDDEREDE